MTSRSPLSLASLMNDPTPPPVSTPITSPQQQIPLSHHSHPQFHNQNNNLIHVDHNNTDLYTLHQQHPNQSQNLNLNQQQLFHMQHQHQQSSPPPPPPQQQQQHQQQPQLDLHQMQSSPPKKTQLSTSSPEGIQVASKITSTRLADLLIRKGPLPIRHITAQLALEVPSFDLLSLSKQRRLIMAAMDQPDTVNNVVFEKIGWGQWAVRKIDSDYIVTEGTESSGAGAGVGNTSIHNPTISSSVTTTSTSASASASASLNNNVVSEKLINVNDLRNQLNLKLGWTKKKKASTLANSRRESITNQVKSLHNIKLPNEKIDSAMMASEDDSDDDEEEEDDYALSDTESSEDGLFPFDERNQLNDQVLISQLLPQSHRNSNSSQHRRRPSLSQRHSIGSVTPPPPLAIKFARRVPIKTSPPPQDGTTRRRRSSSSAPNSITKPYRQHLFNRSRLNSLENLDNYIVSSAKNSSVLINSPPPAISFSSSPATSTTYEEHQRRKSSFNESHVRSTLANVKSSSDETDDEDWAAIGPESLRKRKGSMPAALRDDIDSSGVNEEEKSAAFALVDLMSV